MRNEGQRVAVFSSALPLGWATATIGDIIGCDGLFVDGDWVESKDQDPKGDVRLTQLADIGDGVYRDRSNRFLKYEKAVQLGCTFLQPNDLMVARMPDPLGRACIFPGDSKPSVTAVDVCIVRTGLHGADHHWLMHAINSPIFRSAVASLQSGSTRKRISRSNLAKLEFPLPPLPEQHRIVAKIEELLTRLDAGQEALKRVKTELSRYRQTVLKYAFEGKLAEEWREAHKGQMEAASVLLERIREARKNNAKGRYKEPSPVDTSDLPALPEGWVWTRLGNIGVISSGYGFPKKYQGRTEGEIPFFKVMDISKAFVTKKIYLKDAANYISVGECNEIKAKPLRAGTIVFAKIGEAIRLNRRAILSQDSLVDNNVMGILPLPGLADKHFVFYLLLTLKLADYSRATTVPSVRKTDVEQILLPLPPLPEQQRIVEEIERYFSVADEIEKVVEQSLMRSERLRHSILKRAFEGKLVPQDPTDEPAEKLLERIKAEKAKREVDKKATGKGRSKFNTIQRRLI